MINDLYLFVSTHAQFLQWVAVMGQYAYIVWRMGTLSTGSLQVHRLPSSAGESWTTKSRSLCDCVLTTLHTLRHTMLMPFFFFFFFFFKNLHFH